MIVSVVYTTLDHNTKGHATIKGHWPDSLYFPPWLADIDLLFHVGVEASYVKGSAGWSLFLTTGPWKFVEVLSETHCPRPKRLSVSPREGGWMFWGFIGESALKVAGAWRIVKGGGGGGGGEASWMLMITVILPALSIENVGVLMRSN